MTIAASTSHQASSRYLTSRHLSLRQWRYALAAAERSNVTTAAAALNVSQPAISAAIAALEAHFGRALFVRRKGQGISATPFGLRLFARARILLAEAADLASMSLTVDSANELIGGDVVLACHHDLAPYFLPRLLTAIRTQHPGIAVHFREGDFETIAQSTEEDSVDLALSFDVAFDRKLAITELSALPLCALLAAGHPLARKRTIALRDLASERFIISEQPRTWQHVIDLFVLHGLAMPRVAARVTGFELQRGLVANGHGVALAYTRPAVDCCYDGAELAIRDVVDAIPPQKILLVRNPANPPSRACEAVMRVIVDWFKRGERQPARLPGGREGRSKGSR